MKERTSFTVWFWMCSLSLTSCKIFFKMICFIFHQWTCLYVFLFFWKPWCNIWSRWLFTAQVSQVVWVLLTKQMSLSSIGLHCCWSDLKQKVHNFGLYIFFSFLLLHLFLPVFLWMPHIVKVNARQLALSQIFIQNLAWVPDSCEVYKHMAVYCLRLVAFLVL